MHTSLPVLLNVSGAEIGYTSNNKQVCIYKDIDLSVRKNDFIALAGPNGVGKSTLLRSMTGLQKILSGNIFFRETNLSLIPSRERACFISFVSTEVINTGHVSVYDAVALGRIPYNNWLIRLKSNDRKHIQNALQITGIEHLAKKQIYEISDGERQKVMIARAIAQDSEVMILDEPTAFLDVPGKYRIISLLRSLVEEHDKTVVFSTHDIPVAINESKTMWLMDQNKITSGVPEDLMLNGNFSGIFVSDYVSFDINTGHFLIKRENKIPVIINGSGNAYICTLKALTRNNYFIPQDKKDAIIKISINENQDSYKWEIIKKEKHYSACSISELLSLLSSLTIER